jgi:transcriptional regulator with XRE-family HTH domain
MIAFSARRLRDARTAAGLSPEHVAVATGRSSFSVREWERGRVTPPTNLLGQIAATLGINVADLFEGPTPGCYASSKEAIGSAA